MIKEIDKRLAILYSALIDKSWSNSKTFEAYQDSWNIIAEVFKVAPFDWTKGHKPHTTIFEERNDSTTSI